MNSARFQALCLTCIGVVCILSSCGPKAKQADAVATIFGQAAGVVVEYNTPLDKTSINKETFQVKGKSIMSVFVSNSNHFKKDNSKDSDQGDGRYVIILLNQPANSSEAEDLKLSLGGKAPKLNLEVTQVAPVNTAKGAVIKPWSKALKTKESYFVEGWLK
ncbi:MAG: hypothetical protein K6F06_11820 [Bacteroidales bacterium]|nr:hypothetical protein [Bacteroidales bacterium]